MNFSDYIIYVDESGDHNPVQPNSSYYPIFSLAFCIFKKSDYLDLIVPKFKDLKFRWFGHDAFVFHEREIRKRVKPFNRITPKDKNDSFMIELNHLMAEAQMTIVASVIDKNKLSGSVDPYALALRFCLESVMLFLKEKIG